MTEPTKPARRRRSKNANASLSRTWLIRFGVALGVGLAIGAAGGIVGVNVMEPGNPAQADSLQLMLDSISRGTAPRTPRAEAESPAAAPVAAPATDSVATALVTVPDLVGVDEGGARTSLQEAGLSVGGTEFRASQSPAGTVLATIPVFGTTVSPGTAIVLVLSDGRPPTDTTSR